MSRIGNLPVNIPEGVTVNVTDDNTVNLKGPKGELSVSIDRDIKVEKDDNQLLVKRPSE